MIEDHEAVTYGVAFQLINEAALDYLNNREVALGGYISHITMFIPQDPTRMPMPVLLYVATPSNQHWLGHASSEHIANQVRLLPMMSFFEDTCDDKCSISILGNVSYVTSIHLLNRFWNLVVTKVTMLSMCSN